MKNEYPVYSKGKGEHVVIHKGLSDKTALELKSRLARVELEVIKLKDVVEKLLEA